MLDDVDNRRHNRLVVNPWNAKRKQEKRLKPAYLRLTQQEWDFHRQRLLDEAIGAEGLQRTINQSSLLQAFNRF
jgi:hypothetical protein